MGLVPSVRLSALELYLSPNAAETSEDREAVSLRRRGSHVSHVPVLIDL